MESDWHVVSITLLDELVRNHLGAPKHYFCGGNMFIYYSVAQAKEVEEYVEAKTVARKPRFKGPDFFLVRDVDGTKPRESWVVWDEGGRYPDLVVEFISTSTRKKDVDENVKFYAKVFRVPEYFWFDRRSGELVGYRLSGSSYTLIRVHHLGSPPEEKLRISLSTPSTPRQHFTISDTSPNNNTLALRRCLSHKPTSLPTN
jgi:Uma2 family endonuclease